MTREAADAVAGNALASKPLTDVAVAMVLSNDAASDPRVDKEARALASAGASVTVVAWDRSRALAESEERGEYRVRRVGPSARHGAGLKNIGAYRQFWANACDLIVGLQPDVVHCHDTDTAVAGLRALRRLGEADCALVLDLHEFYRESRMIPQRGVKGALAKAIVSRIERNAARKASLVIVANPGQASLVAGVAVDDARVVVVQNAPDTDWFAPSGRKRSADDPMTVCFIGQKRTADHLVDLMDAIDCTPGTRALIAGGGPAAEEVAAAAGSHKRIEAVGWVTYEEIPAMYAECDAVYAVYDTSVGNYRTHFPVKAMEAMAVGVPVLVSAGTWVASYVEENGVGSAAREHDVAAIAEVLRTWRDDSRSCSEMGRRGRELIEGGLNWQSVSARFVAAYADAVGEKRGRGLA